MRGNEPSFQAAAAVADFPPPSSVEVGQRAEVLWRGCVLLMNLKWLWLVMMTDD